MNRNRELIATCVISAALVALLVLTDASESPGMLVLIAALVLGIGAFAIRRWAEAGRLERELRREIEKGTEAERRLRESAESARASEKRLREAQRVARMGDYTLDVRTGEITLSDGVLDLLGYDPNEKIDYARIETQIRHPEDRERVARWLELCIASGSDKLTPNEYRAIRKDGSVIWVRSLGEIERGDEGTVRVFGTLQDITDRKQAESETDRLRALMEAAFESSPAGIIVAEAPDVKITLANSAALGMRGADPRDLTKIEVDLHARRWQTFYPDGTPCDPKDLPLSRAVLEGRTTHDVELMIRNEQGEDRWILGNAAPVRDSSGSVVGGVVVFPDITKRKRAEEALLTAKNFAENLVETASAIVVVLDRSGEIRVFNKAAEEITGYTREELTGKNWFEVIVPRERYPAVWDEFQRLTAGGIPEKYENPILTKDGRERHIVWRNSEWKQSGKFHGTVSFGVDITDRKNTEAALENSERRLRALSARLQLIREEECERIARELHDELGQALTVLKFDLASLVRKLGRKSADGGVEALIEKTESMAAFVDETIQIVRTISTELRPRVLDDAGLIQALEWQAREFERRTEIRCAFTSEDSDLTVDRERSTALFRIFQEILTNVARHAAARRVEAVLRRSDVLFELVVRDDGRGISDDEIARPGSLGIVGMRERAHAFGGEVRLEGRPDEGTVVTVHIPVERTGVPPDGGVTRGSDP